jgi:group I intron endonuclease
VYIGQSINIEERWKSEKKGLINKNIKNDFIEFGIDNFSFEVLEEVASLNERNKREKYYIEFFNSIEKGYNLQSGGNVDYTIAESTKKLLSEINSGEGNSFYGKKHSKESLEKISKKASKRIKEKNSFFGKKHSEEAKEKIGKANSGKNSGRARAVEIIELALKFDTVLDCSLFLNKKYSGSVFKSCNTGSYVLYDGKKIHIKFIGDDDYKTIEAKSKGGKNAISLRVNGKEFKSITECSDYFNVSKGWISTCLKKNKPVEIDGKEYKVEILNKPAFEKKEPGVLNNKKKVRIKELNKVFNSLRECADFLNVSSSMVCKACKNDSFLVFDGNHISFEYISM